MREPNYKNQCSARNESGYQLLTDDEIEAILEVGYEHRRVEFKAAGSTRNNDFLTNVARAILALSNQRDGGHVIIGYRKEGLDSPRTGLNDVQIQEWMAYDDVTAKVNVYADPPAQFEIASANLPNDRKVVVIEVAEFVEVPILSKRDYKSKIVANRLYTRSMAKPESNASLTQDELREVLTLATEKQLTRLLGTMRSVGVDLEQSKTVTANEQFESRVVHEEEGDFHIDQRLPLLRTVIHPEKFDTQRISYAELLPSVEQSTVRMRGWPFPWVDIPDGGQDWVGEQVDSFLPESWKFFQSGLFLDYRRIWEYQPDSDRFSDGKATGYLPVWLVVAHFTEVIEFAGRLQRVLFTDETMTVDLTVSNIEGYELVARDPRRSGLYGNYRYSDSSWRYRLTATPEEGLTRVRELAARASLELLQRFGWPGVTVELLAEIQRDIFGAD